jgi:Fur family ferric uptake transcriptional regulator
VTIDPADRLRSAGLRATRQRVAILEVLASAGGHRTAEEIGQALAVAGVAVPRATLYHALGTLAASRAIVLADAGPGTTRYEVATEWHHHHVCRACGAITDVPCVRGSAPCLEPDLRDVTVDEAQVIFRGLCAECAAREGDGPGSHRAA